MQSYSADRCTRIDAVIDGDYWVTWNCGVFVKDYWVFAKDSMAPTDKFCEVGSGICTLAGEYVNVYKYRSKYGREQCD